MAKNFFIIGMRRSGTSILRQLMLKHPSILDIEFEPHPLWHAVDTLHFDRIVKSNQWAGYVRECRNLVFKFRNTGLKGWYGAKFALNPGVKALEWKWLYQTDYFPKAKYIFIIRNKIDTHKSYVKQDRFSLRGVIHPSAYITLYDQVIESFNEFSKLYRDQAITVHFEQLVKNADFTLQPVWKFLGLKPLEGLQSMIKKPEHWSGG